MSVLPDSFQTTSSDGERAPGPANKPRAALRRIRRRDELVAWLFLLPGLLAFAVFVVTPALGALVLSFFDWRLFDDPSFVGTKHVGRLFSDANMWSSLGVTGIILALGVIPTVFLGFMLAVVASSTLPGIGLIRVLYFTPMVASSAITSVLWTNLYRARDGFINQALAWFNIQGPNWLAAPGVTRNALVVVLIWSALPVVIILYIAAIQKIPEDIYSASAVDGAGKWRQLWSMTWPSVMPTTAVITILMFITFLGSPLEFALLMTDGGPLSETTTLGLYAFKMAFERRDMGYASALAFWQLIIIGAIFLLINLLRKAWRTYR